jgi:hypothetical protein
MSKYRIIEKYSEQCDAFIYIPQRKVMFYWVIIGKESDYLYSTFTYTENMLNMYIENQRKRKLKPIIIKEYDI